MKYTLTWDMTLAWNAWFRDEVTLPALKRAGYDVVGLTVGGDNGGRPAAMAGIESVLETIRSQPALYRLVRTAEDVLAAQREGQLAIELNFQGSNALEGRIEAVGDFHALGMRHMGLVWNSENLAGSSCTGGTDNGLTDFGRQLVREMNRVGVIVDGSHASYRTTMEAIECCEKPFIFSHGNVDAVAASYKNLRDDQIRACAATGGVIGISGFGTYLDDPDAPAASLLRQIDYVCELVGPRHVGLGLDYVRDARPLWEKVRANPDMWPGVRESRFFPPDEVWQLRSLMEAAGYSPDDVAAVMGGNWLRVGAACWSS